MKSCKMHDLLRDLSLKEAQKQRFYHVVREDSPGEGPSRHRRIVVRKWFNGELNANNYMPHARSYTCYSSRLPYSIELPRSSRLLRILNIDYHYGSPVDFLEFINARYVNASIRARNSRLPSSIGQLWNLHTLIITPGYDLTVPIEIWEMPQLRHVEFKYHQLEIPNPSSSKDDEDTVVMENLHTLKGVRNLKLNEEVVKRIPNINKLKIYYKHDKDWESGGVNCISYLHCLENLYFDPFFSSYNDSLQKITRFPHSLKKLTLYASIELDNMLPKIGLLPHLQKLTLIGGSFKTRKWETSEGQFPSLKFLSLRGCRNLENWTVSESSHFPRLQELRLVGLREPTLEIPSETGEIATLENIVVEHCSESVVVSAKMIAEEQEDLCGDLHVTAIVH